MICYVKPHVRAWPVFGLTLFDFWFVDWSSTLQCQQYAACWAVSSDSWPNVQHLQRRHYIVLLLCAWSLYRISCIDRMFRSLTTYNFVVLGVACVWPVLRNLARPSRVTFVTNNILFPKCPVLLMFNINRVL